MKTAIVASVISAIIFLMVGALIGLNFQANSAVTSSQVAKTNCGFLVNNLKSKTINSIYAIGILSKISGENITLKSTSDTSEISVPASTKVYQMQDGGTKKEIKFSDLKIGQTLNVFVSINSTTNTLEAKSILIY